MSKIMYYGTFAISVNPHNRNYVVFLFNTAKVRAFVFVCDVPHPYSLYKFLWCLQMNVPKYQQVLQCLFAYYNKFSQKDDENYVDILYPLKLRRFRTMLLTSSKYKFSLFHLFNFLTYVHCFPQNPYLQEQRIF